MVKPKPDYSGHYILSNDLMPVYLDASLSADAQGPFESFDEAKEAMLKDIEGQILNLKQKYSEIAMMEEK